LQNTDTFTITKRKRKTQQSIVDKLRRQPNLRLPQMQDIAGCRIVLTSGIKQASELNNLLLTAFTQQKWKVDSKERDKDGYRAIHIIAKLDKQFYEIQLRTYAQDIWANLVERMSDEKNTLKYGGNEQEQITMNQLKKLSESFVTIDQSAHNGSIELYQQQIEEAIRHVLSD
jgi:ppGpp synthetase/RelA/SpoT-type nucleotidyltranferase